MEAGTDTGRISGERRVTLTVTDEEATEFLTPGEHFELWKHHKVGHGVISRRVVV
ncbi:hypothetical protein GCM10023195_17990 [Actinoallomurus liliacearum]|uniref:Uncharacterized protein n=1 Tax=Actinoallomurus liliacearum TaxID=1080073 RepID=A0ABP8TDD8_9ACTN